MRLPIVCVTLLTLTLSAAALRQPQTPTDAEAEENQSNKNAHLERHGRRRNNNNSSSNNKSNNAAATRQQLRQPQSKRQQQQQQRPKLSSEEEEQQEEDYDWTDVDTSAMATGDSFEAVVEPVRTQSAPYDIFACCNEVFGSCRESCENLSLVQLATDPRAELKKYCQLHQLEFWGCLNRTLEAVARGSDWSGRRCCQFGVLQHCRNACATSSSSTELSNGICRRSDEQQLYDCLERQDAADRCCGQARTSECLQACRAVFETPNENESENGSRPHPDDRLQLDRACGERNADVLQCINNHTDMTPLANAHQYLPCCKYSNNEHCSRTCRALLHQNVSQVERSDVIFERLQAAGCGTPLPHLPFWQCFLTVPRKLYVPAGGQTQHHRAPSYAGANEQTNQLGIDAAKRQCCEFASSHKCRRLCSQIFSNDWWETRASFDSECLEQPAELELRRCIESVDAPCELGCDGLSFCTNFNNRPTELFRSCTPAHDAAAREDLLLLQQRGYVRVLGQELHIKNTTRCAPEKWQALVCALQLQPCTRVGLYNGICREDCNELLDECLDWTRQTQRPQAICARLQPTLSEDEVPPPCISLRAYLERGDAAPEAGGHYGLTAPCAAMPCNGSEVCVPQRNGSQGYSCIPSCSLGQASSLSVPFGAYLRVGKTSSSAGTGLASGQLLMAEHMVCRCGRRGQVEQCQPLPSYTHAHCVLPGGRSFRHGESFYLECNLCSCFAGEITCTKQQCRLVGYTDASYTSLPCNCPAHYVPVCGVNGNTYPSACVAKCLGLQETSYVYGACNARNACQAGTHDCPVGTQCLEQRQICLSSMQRPCSQHVCVNITASSCSSHHSQELCDTRGQTYTNACALLQSNGQLAYWGACLSGRCAAQSSITPVCGINGVTYRSTCAAWADYVLVDYVGRCREVGLLAADMGRRCRTVKCPAPVSQHCRHIVPPGACCPICAGGAFRIIYSRKQLDRAMYALRGSRSSLLTLHGVLQQLDQMVQVSECQLTGFLTMEVGIFVALVTRSARPTRLQLEACAREAEKISALISAQSPRITTNLALSSLTVSHVLEPSLYGRGLNLSPTLMLLLPVALIMLIRSLK
ncbi:reversion-inducing cysteine-rich protein with Kazal motifs [Scaptodrosophila lebanonensis]|uniref:Reversion-inducing cysteine-rich protein with Kazal motifs n=1 Tax=Drosophila lebanonensis TaxID=7225 RepID=A0A6J2UCR1_DROLE|nr:reversion-inducing cysteine-rich protein with Kazal motifs [Scaptodrosophila lebanonensis]